MKPGQLLFISANAPDILYYEGAVDGSKKEPNLPVNNRKISKEPPGIMAYT